MPRVFSGPREFAITAVLPAVVGVAVASVCIWAEENGESRPWIAVGIFLGGWIFALPFLPFRMRTWGMPSAIKHLSPKKMVILAWPVAIMLVIQVVVVYQLSRRGVDTDAWELIGGMTALAMVAWCIGSYFLSRRWALPQESTGSDQQSDETSNVHRNNND